MIGLSANEPAKRLVEEAEARVGAARAHLETMQARVPVVSRAQKDAELAIQVAESALSVHDAKTSEVTTVFERATHRVDTERNASTETAQIEVDRLSSQVRTIDEQIAGLKNAFAGEIERIRASAR